MVSPQKYLGILAKSITGSQQLWIKLSGDKADLIANLSRINPSEKSVLLSQLGSLRKTANDQVIFLNKVGRHIEFFSEWCSRENVENLAFVPIKKYVQAVFSHFEKIKSNIAPLRDSIFEESELLNKVDNSNFAKSWPRFLALYDAEKQLREEIEASAIANDVAVKELVKALKNVSARAQPMQVRGIIGTLDFGARVVAAGLFMYFISPLVLPEEALEMFGGLSVLTAGSAVGIGIVDFLKKSVSLTMELAKR